MSLKTMEPSTMTRPYEIDIIDGVETDGEFYFLQMCVLKLVQSFYVGANI